MGARVEGKKKKKSVKAKVTSKFSSKRKLSRMGKKVKKGEMGPSTEFITRSMALKKLQITLKDFRRLCILKGIYPRVPTTKAPKGSDKVYYDIKDISYLAHEPLLVKFREFKAFMKKIRRAAGRNQHQEARRKDEFKPVMMMDHLVKERYPRFIDALRDMDDALCMVHLFAALPSEGRVTVEHSTLCAQLVGQWQYYVAKSRTLHKVFVSVKGVYFQAEIMGEPITWLVPHSFTQALPKEVDLRVMITFLEFYEVFLKFVLFKLYHMQGLHYPPQEDQNLKENGCFLLAIKAMPLELIANSAATSDGLRLENGNAITVNADNEKLAPVDNNNTKQISKSKHHKNKVDKETAAKLATLSAKLQSIEYDEDDDEEVGEALSAPLAMAFSGLQDDNDALRGDEEKQTFALADDDKSSKLFAGLKFFVNREVPLPWIQFCTLSFGAQIGWEGLGSPFAVDDSGITHQVVDRPMQGIQSKEREYVQPQWVFDSINAKLLLPVSKYRPGMALPPHLSPFVDDEKEGYVPKYKEEIKKLQASSSATSAVGGVTPSSSSNGKNTASQQEIEELDVSENEEEDDDNEEEEEEDEEDAYQKEVRAERIGKSYSKSKLEKNEEVDDEDTDSVGEEHSEDEDDGSAKEDSEDESEGSEEEEEEEEEEKPKFQQSKKGPKAVMFRPSSTGSKAEVEEEADLAKIMMSKKTKRLFGRMQHGIEKKKAAVQLLENKRRKLEEATKTEKNKQSVASDKKKEKMKATKGNKQQSKNK